MQRKNIREPSYCNENRINENVVMTVIKSYATMVGLRKLMTCDDGQELYWNSLNPIQAGGRGSQCVPLQVFALLCQNGLQKANETF